MASKEIVTMPCDPPWDPWTLDESSTINIRSVAGSTGGIGNNNVGLISETVTLFSSAGLPISGEVEIRISAIKDPELDEDGFPKDSTPTEVVIDNGEAIGLRNGDTIKATFDAPVLGLKEEGIEYDDSELIGDKVIRYHVNIRMELTIESLTYEPIGPFPSENVSGVNNMFWENDVMDCKASGSNDSLRRMGSREKGANWLIGSPGNKWDSYCGWEKLFTGDIPNTDGRQSGKHGKKGTCLQLATNNQMSAGQGIIIGNWRALQKTQVARWMNPTGVQFQWTTKNTPKKNANGLKLKHLWLIYKEANDGVPRYCPVINNYEAQGEYVFEGNNLIGNHQKRDQYGNFRASISAEDIIQVNERDSVCIAMMMVFNNAKAGAVYYNIIDIYNFTFLFYNAEGTIDEYTGLASASTPPTLATNSKIIVPSPFAMSEWDSGYFPIF